MFRADEFRPAFAEIGEVRSIVPDGIPVLALTATTTYTILQGVVSRLSLRVKEMTVVAIPPQRCNITYYVRPLQPISDFGRELSDSLSHLRTEFPKSLVFCRKYQDCSELYLTLRTTLGANFTDPPGYPDLHSFHLVEMYTRAATTDMKENILSSFTQTASKLRLVIATTAFGMGIDSPDIRQVIHSGPPCCLEEYVHTAYYNKNTSRNYMYTYLHM